MFNWIKNLFRKKNDSVIVDNGTSGLGVVEIVYDKKKHPNSNSYHCWIPVLHEGEKKWARFTAYKTNEALYSAKRNPEDIPYKL